MKQTVLILIVSILVGFGGGYLFYQGKASSAESRQTAAQPKAEAPAAETKQTTAQDGDSIFKKKQCLTCHAVSKLGLQGGTTGPDLSEAYKNVEGKHGKPIEEFLKAPTSAVMSGVMKGNPLTDDERAQILAALKQASEK
ncbi:c-type cytochrome [Ectobacillus ponti]|uniref:C-type cytochrome n=1 Tax=Ectobacillus ponti TaxID=2961894 RepID=A0AA41XCP6_9BACI|nr:c-type cytochrome [Ectobacillus ponti]MCP8971015.1 c-type cytochrome [Ectobacillus ponti]